MLESIVLILFNSKCEVEERDRKERREIKLEIFAINILGSPYKEKANVTLVPVKCKHVFGVFCCCWLLFPNLFHSPMAVPAFPQRCNPNFR